MLKTEDDKKKFKIPKIGPFSSKKQQKEFHLTFHRSYGGQKKTE